MAPEEAGARLDTFVAMRCPELSRAAVQRLIEQGRVAFDGRDATAAAPRASTRVRAGDAVTVDVPPPREDTPRAEALPIVVVYQDEDLAVVEKPAGMVVHPAAGHAAGTLVNALLHHLDHLSGIGGVLRPGIVHRLDRDTSGLMVVSKNDAAHRALQAQFQARTVTKLYSTFVLGTLPAQGTWDTPYGRHPVHRKRFTSRAGARRAISHFRRTGLYGTAAGGPGVSAAEVRLVTGRTHQVRVHFAEAGFPLVGDALYGRPDRAVRRLGDARLRAALDGMERQALHARHLVLQHPRTGADLSFESPLPADMAGLLERLTAL